MQYNYLIVGAGLSGAILAHELNKKGKKCLVIDKRNHIGGNCYTKNIDRIEVHYYGPHIFHTDKKEIWDYINQFGEFNPYINQPLADIDGTLYNLPFNMNLFSKVFDISKPSEVKRIIESEIPKTKTKPKNLEEQAIKLIGTSIYEMFIKGYTEKQWGRKCTDLPPEIIQRLPFRFTYNTNYYNDRYQGIPKDGYTILIENILQGTEVRLNTDYKDMPQVADKIIYTGMIDEYFNYCYGKLEYRTLEFVHLTKDTDNYQGCAVINYPNENVPYTRSIEHKHFDSNCKSDKTVVSYEFSKPYKNTIPYYPIGNKKNNKLYLQYKKLAEDYPDLYFIGRLGEYKYYDMDDTIENVLSFIKNLC